MDEYLVPTGAADAEFTERRSRFIGHIFPVDTEEEALLHLKQMRETYWNANHNVYAYILHGGATRYSDDSEPQGTAGMPVLEVLRREGLENVLCVVTRYFGGILLGAGGLVRAYTKGAKLAVDAAGISRKRIWQTVDVPCPYALFERMRQLITDCGGMVREIEYGADVTIHAILPRTETEACRLKLTDASSGKVTAAITGEEYRAFPIAERKEPSL